MPEKLHNMDIQCCKSLKDNEEDLALLDSCYESSLQLTSIEKSTLYYISGYVAFKEGCAAVDVQEIDGDDSEFLNRVSRGRLAHPPVELYDLSQYLFSFFKCRETKCCSKSFLEGYKMIYDTSVSKFDNILSILRRFILRRFNNCFFKAFASDVNDKLKRSKNENKIKQRRVGSE